MSPMHPKATFTQLRGCQHAAELLLLGVCSGLLSCRHRLVIFRDQGQVSGQRQVEISQWFGPLESTFYKHPASPHPDVFRCACGKVVSQLHCKSFAGCLHVKASQVACAELSVDLDVSAESRTIERRAAQVRPCLRSRVRRSDGRLAAHICRCMLCRCRQDWLAH